MNFWEKDLGDKKVFLTAQAHAVNETIQLPAESSLKGAILAYIKLAIPAVPDPNVTYIDHLPPHARIGDKIAALRDKTNYTQWQVAQQAGLSQGQLSLIENRRAKKRKVGEKRIKEEHFPLNTLKRIATVLQADIYDLLDLQEAEYPELVVRVDRFFRSSQVPPETKIKVWTTISSIIEQADDCLLFQPKPSAVTQA